MSEARCKTCGTPVAAGSSVCANCSSQMPDWRRQITLILTLLGITIVLFAAAWFLNHSFSVRRDALAEQWFNDGQRDLANNDPKGAVAAYRSALFYRDSDLYRLRLAEALASANYIDQTKTYLLNLWEERPGSGNINLELARIAVRQNDIPSAIRFYHGAIYGLWDTDAIQHRLQTRLELIHFLLEHNEKENAYAEITALAAGAPSNDARLQATIGELFQQTGDIGSALAQFEAALKIDRNLFPALRGAATTSFQSGDFYRARRYLEQALRERPEDPQLREMFQQTGLVLKSDPFERHLPQQQRIQRTLTAFEQAGKRLQQCGAAPVTPEQTRLTASKQREFAGNSAPANAPTAATTPAANLQMLAKSWSDLRPNINARSLSRNSDLIDAAMDLVFRIEQATVKTCGAPTGEDWALLQLSNQSSELER